ncbi:MAG: MlaD family protein [Desulfobacteraceae bacterium]|jgi:phospholipid/cholesterol/gamma-HCH transport system substrate-binding protein
MATLKTKFSVGLFLICGLTVVIVGIIWLGMSNYLEKGRLFVAYYDESVQGLDVDSPVKYRGVHIGRVHRIGVAPDGKMIEVVLKIESEIKPNDDGQNLVAQLKSVGITGLMFIELEQKTAGDRAYPSLNFKPEYPVISTRPSEISKIFKGIEDIFNLFRGLDANTISNQLTEALKKINQTIDDAKLAEMVNEFRTTIKEMQKLVSSDKMDQLFRSMEKTSNNFSKMAINADGGISDIRQTVGRLDRAISSSGPNIQEITTDLKASARQVKQAMETATALLANTDRQVDSIQRQVSVTLERIDRASATMNRLLNQLSNQPSQVIFSAPAIDKP